MLAAAVMVTVGGGRIERLYLLEVQNDATGTPDVGNYDVRLVDEKAGAVTRQGRVERHRREEGALALLHKAIHAIGDGR